MRIIKELWGGMVGTNGDGSRKLEVAVVGMITATSVPEQAWPIAAIVGSYLLARGVHDAALARSK